MLQNGPLTRLPIASAARQEIKHTLGLLRRLIACEPSAELLALHRQQLRCLKRVHYDLLRLEQVATTEATRRN